MKEEELYNPIGKWLIKEKGCQQDEYSQGYLKNIQVGDIRPDILAIRYELVENVYPKIQFHGYVVEVKPDENALNELIGKIMRVKKRIKTSIEWMAGLHTVRLYIGYATEQVSHEIFEICEENDIGILRLQVINENVINVYEVLEPKEIALNGMSHSSQRSPGIFEHCMNEIGYLRQMFQRPENLYDYYIRPKIEEYKAQIELRQALDYPKDKLSREARDFLIENIQSEFPQLEMTAAGSTILFTPRGGGREEAVFSIEHATKYFYISFEQQRYRVCSQNQIIEFKNSGKEYEGNLKNLIASIIIPRIKTKLLNLKGK
ncbi:hypothetical protein M1N83_01195 [Dehalococcoidia bacterium]|nr:hypothetical protein [Dehalococcoidia bacterium]